jgi:hypothetical protein
MNRSIETRVKRLEARLAPEKPPCRSHIVAARIPAEGDAKIAELLASGTADPGDFSIRLVPSRPDPASAMHNHYRWDEAAGHWGTKDGRADIG